MVCDGDDEVARLDISRVRTPGISETKMTDAKWRKGGPLPTREGRGAQGHGPRFRGSRLGVLSGKPSGAPIGPGHPDISGGLRRFNVEFTAIWVLFGRFWAVKTWNARFLKFVLA